MLNEIVLMGRVVRTPDIRKTGNGTSVVSFTLAVDRDYGDKETDFIDCVAWRKTADFVGSYFAKGQLMVAKGRLESRTYQDKDGEPHKVWEVIADSVYFGEKKRIETGVDTPAGSFKELEDGELPF